MSLIEHGPAWLFCPADRPERYPKALAGADVVLLDLEDAVAGDRKPAAREALSTLELDLDRTALRINGLTLDEHRADVELATRIGLRTVLVPKADDPAAIAALPFDVIAICESPLGVERAGELAAVPNVIGLIWGADDLVAGLGGTASRRPDGSYRDVARYARERCLVGAKAFGKLALDNVVMDIPNVEMLAAECEDAVAVGFDAKLAIHPSQVSVIRDAYRPDADRVDWARRLLAAAGDNAGVFTFEGKMVDGPIFAQARQVLARAEALG
jgi:citrate lyase subunit beta / citryl-CoA lyase